MAVRLKVSSLPAWLKDSGWSLGEKTGQTGLVRLSHWWWHKSNVIEHQVGNFQTFHNHFYAEVSGIVVLSPISKEGKEITNTDGMLTLTPR